MGMDAWQLTCIAVAAIVVLIAVNRFGPPGLLYAAPIYLPVGVFAFVTVHGDSAPRQVGLWLMKQLRHACGATKQVYRPERTQLAGTLNLPGIRASIQLWEVDGVACVYNPHDRSVSVTAEVEVQGFLMKDIAERYDLAQQWSPVLASFTQRPGIKRAVLQERTMPTTIRAAREHYEIGRAPPTGSTPTPRSAETTSEVMNRSEPFAVSHRNYLTFTLDLIALGPQLKSLGGGEDAVKTLAYLEARNLADALRAARITRAPLALARDVAALDACRVRSRVRRQRAEPRRRASAASTPSRSARCTWKSRVARTASSTPTPACTPRCGSTSGRAPTPRSASSSRSCSPGCRPPARRSRTSSRSFSTPVSVKKAMRRIEDDKKVWRGNEQLRAKRGVDGSAADAADWDALERQEEEIVAGHGEFRYGAYLTVTAPDEEKLDQAIAGMRNALARAGMEPQILYCQQAEALMVNALPIGLGMK